MDFPGINKTFLRRRLLLFSSFPFSCFIYPLSSIDIFYYTYKRQTDWLEKNQFISQMFEKSSDNRAWSWSVCHVPETRIQFVFFLFLPSKFFVFRWAKKEKELDTTEDETRGYHGETNKFRQIADRLLQVLPESETPVDIPMDDQMEFSGYILSSFASRISHRFSIYLIFTFPDSSSIFCSLDTLFSIIRTRQFLPF